VTVADTWQVYAFDARANERLEEVKRRALERAGIGPARAAGYEVKFGGGLVRDEARTLSEIGFPDGGALVVLASRRRAAR
jgi:hypothetical protein